MKYLVTINNESFGMKVILEYNSTGYLVAFRMDSLIADEGLMWLHRIMPFILADLDTWEKKIRNCRIEPVQDDISFNGFWNAYNYKVGNKKRAEKLWNLLREDEKLQALAAVRKYDRYLAARPRMEKAYPETWLAHRRWENEFK